MHISGSLLNMLIYLAQEICEATSTDQVKEIATRVPPQLSDSWHSENIIHGRDSKGKI